MWGPGEEGGKGGCAGRQGSGCNKPRGVGEKPDHCAWLMSGKEIPHLSFSLPSDSVKALSLSHRPLSFFCLLSLQINPVSMCCFHSHGNSHLTYIYFMCSLLYMFPYIFALLSSVFVVYCYSFLSFPPCDFFCFFLYLCSSCIL